MKSKWLIIVIALTLFCFVGNALAQGSRRKAQRNTRLKEVTVVISDVILSSTGTSNGAISYQFKRRGRLRTANIGIATVTRIQKQGKDITIKDLKKTDKVVVTLFKDPDYPNFPALAVKVIGKGELPKRKRRRK